MNCKELVYLLEDYLDGSMEEHLRQELNLHIEKCEPCKKFLNTYDTTRILCRQTKPREIPGDVRERLKQFVMAKAREHRRDIEKYRERAARERSAEVAAFLAAFEGDRLTPAVAALFEEHRGRCQKCGAFLKARAAGTALSPVPSEVEEDLGDFLDSLPPGESPVGG